MSKLVRLLVAGCALTHLIVPLTAGAEGDSVDAASDVQARLGIATATLATRTVAVKVPAYGRVLDAGPLAALDAELLTARSAAIASAAEAQRLAALASVDDGASQQSVEAARAAAAADAARRSLAEHRLALEWGEGLARLAPAERQRLLADVATGRAALVRFDPLAPTAGEIVGLEIERSAAETPIAARLLGTAAAVDPRLQTIARFGLVCGADAELLRAGRVLDASLVMAGKVTGVVLPRAALVRFEGATWVWVRTSAQRFERHRVVPATVLEEGWLVTEGLDAHDQVVTSGAGALLALERGGGEPADEDD